MIATPVMVSWDPSLAVGNAEIDGQHQELFRRVDQLLRALQLGSVNAEVERVMAFVGDYVHLHFRSEEALMQRSGYPQRPAHCAEHLELIKSFVGLKKELGQTGPTPEFAAKLGAALVDWLREHIATTDTAFATWLAAQPATTPASHH